MDECIYVYICGGVHVNVISLIVNGMVNGYSLKFVNNQLGQINGEVTTTTTSNSVDLTEAQITVESVHYMNIFAYTLNNELINTAVLNNMNVTSSIKILGVTSGTGSDVLLTNNIACSLVDPVLHNNILDPSNCLVKVSKNHHNGSSNIWINVQYNTGNTLLGIYQTVIQFQVWAFKLFELSAADPVLNKII